MHDYEKKVHATLWAGAWGRALLLGAALLLGVKVWLAGALDLYSDEIFYWLASTKPALAYSDLPFMTALLVGLGAQLGEGSTLAVRAPFLLLGTLLPALVYWLGKPVAGARSALQAAALSLCLPLAGFMGLLAVPDAALVVFGILALGLVERALRTHAWRHWLGAGLAVAGGLCTHYRFLPVAGALLLFLLLHPGARRCWRRPGAWAALGLGTLGLAPALWFNLAHELGGVGFHMLERHPWRFQAEGLLHVVRQALIVTPLLYALLWFTAWRLLQLAQRGDGVAALFLAFALCNLLPYLLLAPWADENSTSLHWPLVGYFPLLVFAPAILHELRERGAAWVARVAARAPALGLFVARLGNFLVAALAALVPAIGFCVTLLALTVVGSQAFQEPLQRLVGRDVLSNKMAGWRDFAAQTRLVLRKEFPQRQPIIITDNYYAGAQLEFAGLDLPIYTLDQDKAVRDGRDLQLRLWRRDAAALEDALGRPALVITQDSVLYPSEKQAILARACRHVASLTLAGKLSLYGGDKAFSYYAAPAVIAPRAEPSSPCPPSQ